MKRCLSALSFVLTTLLFLDTLVGLCLIHALWTLAADSFFVIGHERSRSYGESDGVGGVDGRYLTNSFTRCAGRVFISKGYPEGWLGLVSIALQSGKMH